MQAEGTIGLRQGRGGKGAEQVGGIHGGLFGGGGARGRYGLFGSWVLAVFCFGFAFSLLVDLLLGFKRLIYLVDAFVVRRGAWPAIDATEYVMCSHMPPLLVCFAFARPANRAILQNIYSARQIESLKNVKYLLYKRPNIH